MIGRRDNAWAAWSTLPEDIRARIRTINGGANQDAEFHQRLNDDPVAVLIAKPARRHGHLQRNTLVSPLANPFGCRFEAAAEESLSSLP